MIETLKQRPAWQIHVMAALTCVAAVTIAYFAYIAPRLGLRQLAQQQQVQLATVVATESEWKDKVAALESQAALAKTAARAVAQRSTSPAGLNGRVAQLTDLATAHRLQIDGIEPATVVNGRQPFVPLRLSGRGGYRDVTAMLADVRQTLPDLGVDEISMTAGNPGTAPTFVIRFQWFVPAQPAKARI